MARHAICAPGLPACLSTWGLMASDGAIELSSRCCADSPSPAHAMHARMHGAR